MIHLFNREIRECELPRRFTFPFCYTPHPLCIEAAEILKDKIANIREWSEEIQKGKMFGVLIVKKDDKVGFIAAFSGNILNENHHPLFVPPVCDLLDSEGFFKPQEAYISDINKKIEEIENSDERISLKSETDRMILNYQEEQKKSKLYLKSKKKERDLKRAAGISEEENDKLIKESQFLKAEVKRREKEQLQEIEESKTKLAAIEHCISELKAKRKRLSAALQDKIFEHYLLLNAKGEQLNIAEIFNKYADRTPPAGTGECAAPKLLQYAFSNNLQPLAMAEFWWGESPAAEIRHHGHFYPSCQSKCGPLLTFMLEGLNVEENPLTKIEQKKIEKLKVIYEDEHLMAVNKPEGLLSAPGKDLQTSVCSIIKERYPQFSGPLIVHRLDMATSGILLIAKNEKIYGIMQRQFEERTVKKRYIAILSGAIPEKSGVISLPLCPDINDRPRQMVSRKYGKEATTRYEVIGEAGGHTRIAFYPLTGRTHQLRVHAAHPLGLNCPILGDTLYGTAEKRLYLHAESIAFRHPVTGETIKLCCEPDF